MTPSSRDDLRRSVRARRRQIAPYQRAAAARAFVKLANRALLLRPQRRIALYFAYGYEAQTLPLIEAALRRRCRVYLPVIAHARKFRMQFVLYTKGMPLEANRFGILEPRGVVASLPPQRLDVVFMPLVAFDARGSRLGSGAGFYDRALRHLTGRNHWLRPKLIGIAYECQRVNELSVNSWDIPMNAVITETSLYRFETQQTGTQR